MADELTLTSQPVSWRAWFADVLAHREVLGILARKDFQTRYKRASLGVLWAVAVPVVQGAIMAVVFARVIKVSNSYGFAAYVMSGIVAWAYFSTAIAAGSTAIVDGSSLTDKVWFPRLVLVVVPILSGLVGLLVSAAVLLVLAPIIHADIGWHLLMLLPACALLIAFTLAASLVLAALHVYFRDVKFIVQAALLVWMYVTPVVYPRRILGNLARLVDLNPMTGIVGLFHSAIGQGGDTTVFALAVSVIVTAALLVIGLAAHRHYDRLFVDQL